MEQPQLINNITESVVDDLRQRLSAHSRISIAAAFFHLCLRSPEAMQKDIATLKRRIVNKKQPNKRFELHKQLQNLKDKTTA